jgi:hypothetical protein
MGMEKLGHDLKALQIATINKTGQETYPQQVQIFEEECLAAVEELEQLLSKMK